MTRGISFHAMRQLVKRNQLVAVGRRETALESRHSAMVGALPEVQFDCFRAYGRFVEFGRSETCSYGLESMLRC
jgi:hypothetical protein